MSGMVWVRKKKKYRITSSNAHKVLIHQKNFETLAENLFVKNKKCSNITQEALNHGKKFEPIAWQIYIDVMKFKLKHGAFKWLLFSNPDSNGSISVEVLQFYCV